MHKLSSLVKRLRGTLTRAIAPSPPGAGSSSAALDQTLTRLHARSQFPGFSVALVDAQGVRYQKALGWADLATRQPYTIDTIQPVGSVSKTLIGIALLQAVEAGLFTLDSAINDLLPFAVRNPHCPAAPITLRHLATHTSGILDRAEAYKQAYVEGHTATVTLPDFLVAYLTAGGEAYQVANFAPTAPGAAFHYTNIGAALAAYVVEVKSGRSFADFTGAGILQPLKMTSSSWHYAAHHPDQATLYDEQGQPIAPYTLITYPDGGLRTSCADLCRYLTAILQARQGEGGWLSQAALQTLFTPQFSGDALPASINPREPNQGIFWSFRRNGKIGHAGSDPGVSAFIAFDPATNSGRIFLANAELANETLAGQFAAIWAALEAYEG